jgi:octaprenyl-diphosphate synthase
MRQIAEEVRAVEQELYRQVSSQVELVAQIGKHTLEAGGKRLRPAFVSLSAKATGLSYDPARARLLGACMEMIHMATLIHDDVIDHSDTRRGRATASSVFGNTGSILTGDVLLSKAMSILAHDGDIEIIRKVSDAVVEMAEGEVHELELRGIYDVTEAQHLNVLRMKTASFIESCCEVGALIAGASAEQRLALRTYGHHVGLAFQIVDDLLDYRGSTDRTGKPLATDYKEGCATLPLIYLSSKLAPDEAELARKNFGNGATEEELRWLVSCMRDRGTFDDVESSAMAHLDAAVAAISILPELSARGLLSAVAHFVLRRDS